MTDKIVLNPVEMGILRELNGERVFYKSGPDAEFAFVRLRDLGFIKLMCAEGDCWYVLTDNGRELMNGVWTA